MYEEFGRVWQGPFHFNLDQIAVRAPEQSGVYQLIYGTGEEEFQTAYIGISDVSIKSRLWAHCTGKGNWALGRLADPTDFFFVFLCCDGSVAKSIESHVITNRKPPFNVKPEYKHYMESVSVH